MLLPLRLPYEPQIISIQHLRKQKILLRSSLNAECFCSIVTKLVFSRQMFIKVCKFKFHGNPLRGRRADTYGETPRHDEANSSFRDYANAFEKKNFFHSDHYVCTIVRSLFDCLDSPFVIIFTSNYVKNWRPKQKQRRLIIYHI